MSSVTEPGSNSVPIVDSFNNLEKVLLEDSRKDESVDFGGIELPKGTGKETKVPKKMEAFIEDDFTLDLQKSLAQAFKLHQPINIEGGSSLGKTTIIRDMAAQLGWSLHSINLQGMTEVSDLMGRLTVNPDKKSASEPEFIWVDGPVSAAIREASTGNKVILLLDEYNIADPDVLIRLHEVIDRYEDSDDFILTEHNDERLKMIKENLFIVAASNPPSRGNSEYAGRKPLDRAQFRRWVYKRLPDELPPESFEAFVQNVFSRLGDEPWVGELADAFIGFHTEATSMVKNSEIGEDLPQPISFDMREEPVRVVEFIKEFSNKLFGGNINLAIQSALIFYYVDKILDEAERQKILEKAEKVRVEISSRISLSESKKGIEELGSEEFVAEEAKRLLLLGASPDDVLVILAGNQTETANEIRRSLFDNEKVNVKSIAKSLAGVDGEDKKVLEFAKKGKWQAFCFTQVGIPAISSESYDYEDLLTHSIDKNDKRAILLALAGDESSKAQETRHELYSSIEFGDFKKGEWGKSLIGCRTELSEERGSILQKHSSLSTKAYQEIVALNLAYSVIGRTVEENSDLHTKLIEEGFFDQLMISLVGDDSEEAWKIRDEFLSRCSDEFRARALSGLFSERAQIERQKIEDNNLYLLSLNGEWEVAALRARGVIPGVRE